MGFKKDKKVLDALIAEFKRVKLIHVIGKVHHPLNNWLIDRNF